ncbi:unnamed protein product [Fraxinus pennsylvanica]|uniref:Uncharacterized protein n=1 Tax=Fraxinus pennsylvanica TaxID=56036 RepID=A0AAD1ZGA8_9LAMI|nr:unnamed protein product [Fraxinus pennsylvanica]
MLNYENDPSKARLFEALCNSHTRAWEAEKAVEKEHIIQLIFRQASQLFAYKQWFQLLQLEKIYFQIKNNNSQQISTISPLKSPGCLRELRKHKIAGTCLAGENLVNSLMLAMILANMQSILPWVWVLLAPVCFLDGL